MSPNVVVHYVYVAKSISEPFSVSTLIGLGIIARRINRGCVASILYWDMVVDMILLDIVYFHVIFRMYWLHSYYATMYCRTVKVTFHFPSELWIDWEGRLLAPKGKIISYLSS